jgi:hypothetical protein
MRLEQKKEAYINTLQPQQVFRSNSYLELYLLKES